MVRSRSPLLPVLLFGLFCAVVTAVVLAMVVIPYRAAFGSISIYFTLLTWVLLAWQEQDGDEDPQGGVRRFLAALGIKMATSLILLVCILLVAPDELVLPLTIIFVLHYLAFLGFTTVRLTQHLQRPRRS